MRKRGGRKGEREESFLLTLGGLSFLEHFCCALDFSFFCFFLDELGGPFVGFFLQLILLHITVGHRGKEYKKKDKYLMTFTLSCSVGEIVLNTLWCLPSDVFCVCEVTWALNTI
jgi:hypothetical protein